MANFNYIGSSLDCHMTDREYVIYERFMKDTFWCVLCEAPHNRIKGKIHSMCQINDYPEDWNDV